MKQTIPLPFREIQELVEAAQRGGALQHITPETFEQIQNMVRAGAPEFSKIEQDAFSVLCAGVTEQYRIKEEKQQRGRMRQRWRKRGAA